MAPRTAHLKEWIGKTPESMPGQIVLLRLYAKQNGLCACGCTRVMSFERDVIHCDHKIALADGGENRESNLQLMLEEHHVAKTKDENIARGKERTHKAKAFKMHRTASRLRGGGGFPKREPQHTATRPFRTKEST